MDENSYNTKVKVERRYLSMFIKVRDLQVSSSNLNMQVIKFYDDLDDLGIYTQVNLEVLDFIFSIRLNFLNLKKVISSFNMFSDRLLIEMVSFVCQRCSEENYYPLHKKSN
jgi:hypothetical protein